MPNIAQVLSFHPNGNRSMEAFLLMLTERVRDRGGKSVFIFSGEPTPDVAARLRSLDAQWCVENFQPTTRDARRWGAWLRQFSPDVLMTTFMSKFSPAVPVLKRASGASRWICVDGTSGTVRRGGAAKQFVARVRGAWISRHLDDLICVSDFIRQRDVEQLYIRSPAHVVHNGIDLSRFRPSGGKEDGTIA